MWIICRKDTYHTILFFHKLLYLILFIEKLFFKIVFILFSSENLFFFSKFYNVQSSELFIYYNWL